MINYLTNPTFGGVSGFLVSFHLNLKIIKNISPNTCIYKNYYIPLHHQTIKQLQICSS